MKNPNILFLILLLISMAKVHTINIVKQKQIHVIQNSVLAKVCRDVMATYHTLGKPAFSIYKGCKDKFEYLGSSTNSIKTKQPVCFENLNKYFCKTSLKAIVIKPKTTPDCSKTSILHRMLRNLKSCLVASASENEAKAKLAKCPKFATSVLKVEDPQVFCKGTYASEDGTMNSVSKFNENDLPACQYFANMFNECIDMNNLLFPSSNNANCFEQSNPIYFCNSVHKMTEKETMLCSDFVLPTMASDDLTQSIFARTTYCDKFGEKIKQKYKERISQLQNIQNAEAQKKLRFEKQIENLQNVKKLADKLLQSVNTAQNVWAQFFKNFKDLHGKQDKILPSELEILNQLRLQFDLVFPFCAKLNRISHKTSSFHKKSFKDLVPSIFQLINIANTDLTNLEKMIKEYSQFIASLKKNPRKNFLLKEKLTSVEVNDFGNQFNSCSTYLKNFTNYAVISSMSTLKQVSSIQRSDKEEKAVLAAKERELAALIGSIQKFLV